MTKKELLEAVARKKGGNSNRGKKGAVAASDAAKEAKKVGDKALNTIAAELPHGSGKQFLVLTKELDDIEGQMATLNKRKRGVRASLKEMKIELRPYDHVRKLRKMEPEDMKSFEASVALYKDQLSMSLSVHQQVIKKELEGQREAARDAMMDASGGDTGKEIGSGVNGNGIAKKAEPAEGAGVPERNDNFRAPALATAH